MSLSSMLHLVVMYAKLMTLVVMSCMPNLWLWLSCDVSETNLCSMQTICLLFSMFHIVVNITTTLLYLDINQYHRLLHRIAQTTNCKPQNTTISQVHKHVRFPTHTSIVHKPHRSPTTPSAQSLTTQFTYQNLPHSATIVSHP